MNLYVIATQDGSLVYTGVRSYVGRPRLRAHLVPIDLEAVNSIQVFSGRLGAETACTEARKVHSQVKVHTIEEWRELLRDL